MKGTDAAAIPPGFSDGDKMATSKEAAAICRRSERTLEHWRKIGVGPEFIRVNGRPLYPVRGLRAFLSPTAA
jgi:hypothetical protein